jgi:hypothetical protein
MPKGWRRRQRACAGRFKIGRWEGSGGGLSDSRDTYSLLNHETVD